ncbi:MAG: isoprenylcysteine carboxylmethyltransferase family protein [Chitinophagales bacterium]|nr:isoprenylcysteine carboxylmethyltransferase family protein [Chitinophagales bacterium]
MVKFGNLIFHNRNFLFPVFYVMLFIPSPPLFHNYVTASITGLLIAMAGEGLRGLTIGLVYIIRAGRQRRIYAEGLFTSGLYAHCRNPLYIGNIMILLGLGVVANSLLFLLIFVPLFTFLYQSIVLAEEDFLMGKFGEAYTAYCKSANRWFPKMQGLLTTITEMDFKWKRVFIEEYNSTYIWLTGAVLLIMKNYFQQEGSDAFAGSLPYFIAVLLLLLLCYLLIRYLKKSGTWKGD